MATQVTVPKKFGFAGSDVGYAQGTGTVSASKEEIDNANAYLSRQAVAPTSTPAPTPVAQREPTIAETLQGIKDKALGIQAQLNNRKSVQNLSYDTATNPYEVPLTDAQLRKQERDIQRNQMRLFQQEIDATNQVYNDMLNQERLAGQGRLGSQTAMAARGGLLGSDFGEAQRQNQVSANLGAERAVENERMAKIGTIMGTMRKAVADEIAQKRLARQQDAESYTKFLAGSKSRKEANVKLAAQSLLDAGLDPLTMDPAELDAIGKEANLSANDIIMQYRQTKAEQETATADSDLKTRKTEAEINKINSDIAKGKLITIGEGTMLYDTETGETFKNPKTYAPGTGSGRDSDDFDLARTLISQNPEMNDDQLREQLLELTNLNVTEVDTLVGNREFRSLPNFDTQVEKIAEKVFDNFDTIEDAVAYAEQGEITSGGKKYQLTPEQIEQLKSSLEEQRGFFQKLVPGGK